MATESVKQRMAAMELDQMSERELRKILEAIVDAIQMLAAKLDADAANAALNDTDYAAKVALIITD